jgi:hypothetical protein
MKPWNQERRRDLHSQRPTHAFLLSFGCRVPLESFGTLTQQSRTHGSALDVPLHTLNSGLACTVDSLVTAATGPTHLHDTLAQLQQAAQTPRPWNQKIKNGPTVSS